MLSSKTTRPQPTPLPDLVPGQHEAPLRLPGYPRDTLTTGVVHVGVGGFHRAHQARYFDDLAGRGISDDWGIAGITLRRSAMRDALAPQDFLYTLVERGPGDDRARVIGALGDCIYAPEQPDRAIRALVRPQTRLVTLTITGAGYDPDAVPTPGLSAFELIALALRIRRNAGVAAFTVLSCDNLPDNGAAAREATLAAAGDDDLVDWISAHARFPASVVDRITPETTDETREFVAHRFGVLDRSPVITEPFSQWIVEDDFASGRPPLERVGVQLVDDVSRHGLVKRRLLNGGHSALGYLGYLAGYRTTDEAMSDPLVGRYVERLHRDEIAPLLPQPAGLDLDEYCATLLERFANPKLGDRLERLCGRGSTKMPAYLLPSLVQARAAGRPFGLLALAVAAWIRYLRGDDLEGTPIQIRDARADELRWLAREGGDDPRPLLARRDLFGGLGEDREVVGAVCAALTDLDRRGVRGALRARLDPLPAHAA